MLSPRNRVNKVFGLGSYVQTLGTMSNASSRAKESYGPPEPQFPHLSHRLVALQVKRGSGTQFLASPAWVSSLPSTGRGLLRPFLAGLGEKPRVLKSPC